MATDGGEPPEREPSADGNPLDSEQQERESADPRARTNPVIGSLSAGLLGSDTEMSEKCGIALCLVARNQPTKVSTIIGQLVEQVVEQPESKPVYRTLAGLVGDHGREIRGALMTETGYSDARRIYGRIEHTDAWELSAVEVDEPDSDEEPSFFSAVMRLVELDERGREPLDSDAWTRFIQRLPGEGGEAATDEELKAAAAREDGRPRAVRKRDKKLQQIASSQLFLSIEAASRFDDLEVLSPVRRGQFGRSIRTRGRIGVNEYAVVIRICQQIDAPAFKKLLTDRLREWARLDCDGVVRVLDWSGAPRPWVATEVVDGRLASQGRLSPTEALDHARILTRALADLHNHGIVHGGIDPQSVGYPPNTLDGVVEPMLDNAGLLPAYTRYTDPGNYLDSRYAAPEYFDDRFGSVDQSSDLYQLGMVLYRALTGNAPFAVDNEDIGETVCHEQPPPPTEIVPDLPAGIDEIIQKATAKQKLTRYETAVQFHNEVRSLCGGSK